MAVLFTDTCLLTSHPFVPPFAMASSSLLAVTFSAVVVVTVVCSRYVFMFCGPSRGPHHSRAGDAHKIQLSERSEREAGRLVLGEMDASIAREANNAACEANRIARLDLNAQRRQARWAMIAAVAAIIAMVAAIWAKS